MKRVIWHSVICVILLSNVLYAQIPALRARFIAEYDNDYLGYNGLTSGDINGDGIKDLILGAQGYDNNGLNNTGRIYVFYGRNFSGDINVQTADIIIDGVTDGGAYSGAGVLSCDVDGDGLYDIMTNAAEIDCVVIDPRGNMPFTLCNFYIFLGKTLITKNYFTTDEADAVITGFFDSTDWRNSIFRVGENPVSGDFNNDGYDDIVFTAKHCTEWSEVELKGYIFYGRNVFTKKNMSILEKDAVFYCNTDYSTFPYYLFLPKKTGDINGDKADDLIITTWITYKNEIISSSCLNYGRKFKDSINLALSDVIIKAEPSISDIIDGMGTIFIQDINNDTFADIILGRPTFDKTYLSSLEGIVYILYGSDQLSPFISSDNVNVTIEGTVEGYFDGEIGESITCGNLNDNKNSDMVIRSNGCSLRGKLFLYNGMNYQDTLLHDYDADAIISDCPAGTYSLSSYMTISDITGDGKEELIVLAHKSSSINENILVFRNDILTGIDEPPDLPKKFSLEQNYPNPFNPSTTIAYELPRSCRVELRIYNSLGQEVRTLVSKRESAGSHKVIWDGKDALGRTVSTGVYIYRIKAGEYIQSRKMMMIR